MPSLFSGVVQVPRTTLFRSASHKLISFTVARWANNLRAFLQPLHTAPKEIDGVEGKQIPNRAKPVGPPSFAAQRLQSTLATFANFPRGGK